MKKKLLLTLTFLVTLSTSLQAISEEEQQTVNAFLANASENVKASLAAELSEKLLGHQNADAPKSREYSDEEKEFLLANLDKIHTLSLTHLNLNNLGLTEVPAGLFSIPGLKVVRLSWNYLTALPADITAANDTLEVLTLNNNQLTHFPTRLLTHRLKTRTILAEGNPLKPLTAKDINSVKLAAALGDTMRYVNNPMNKPDQQFRSWGNQRSTAKPQNFVKIDTKIIDTRRNARAHIAGGGDVVVMTGSKKADYQIVMNTFKSNYGHLISLSADGSTTLFATKPSINTKGWRLAIVDNLRESPASSDNNDNDDGDAAN